MEKGQQTPGGILHTEATGRTPAQLLQEIDRCRRAPLQIVAWYVGEDGRRVFPVCTVEDALRHGWHFYHITADELDGLLSELLDGEPV